MMFKTVDIDVKLPMLPLIFTRDQDEKHSYNCDGMHCLIIPALAQTECSNQRSNDSTDEADDREQHVRSRIGWI